MNLASAPARLRPLRLLAAAVLTCLAAAGCSGGNDAGPVVGAAAPVATSVQLPGANVFPEGVATDPSTRTYYVGSSTDGSIFRGDYGQASASVFLPGGADGRTDVRGLKVDPAGRLFAAGGTSGTVYAYDTRNGTLLARLPTGAAAGASFVNDVAVAPTGEVYATDSRDPVILRVVSDAAGRLRLERWLPLAGTPIVYGAGFNLNGIAVTADGRYLLTVQSNTGRLYRVGTADRSVVQVNLGGATLANGDGLLLDGQTLYAVRNAERIIVKVAMAPDFASGQVVSNTTDASFLFPTTIARADNRLLVVNSQLDRRNAGQPPQPPFTLTSVALP